MAQPTAWVNVAPGIEYARLGDFPNFPGGYLHAFRIKLSLNQLKIALLKKQDQSITDIPAVLAASNAVLATNGGFFTPELTPLGLLISQNQELNPMKATAWWGVFYIKNGQAHIASQRDFVVSPDIEFAIQAGPRLIVKGVIPDFNPKIDYRTAMGITPDGDVVLLATENLLLSTTDLATIMRNKTEEGGLGCVDAINFDGGHSTQLYTRLQNFELQVPSFTAVANAVLVSPKNSGT